MHLLPQSTLYHTHTASSMLICASFCADTAWPPCKPSCTNKFLVSGGLDGQPEVFLGCINSECSHICHPTLVCAITITINTMLQVPSGPYLMMSLLNREEPCCCCMATVRGCLGGGKCSWQPMTTPSSPYLLSRLRLA